MLTTTLGVSARAAVTRLMCPACSAPIVGTRPIVAPAACHSRASARIASGVRTTTGSGPGSVLDLSSRRLGRVGGVLVLRTRESAFPYFVGKLLSRARDVVSEVRVT